MSRKNVSCKIRKWNSKFLAPDKVITEEVIQDNFCYYCKCPKISYIKVANKMAYANSTDPDQTAPKGAV